MQEEKLLEAPMNLNKNRPTSLLLTQTRRVSRKQNGLDLVHGALALLHPWYIEYENRQNLPEVADADVASSARDGDGDGELDASPLVRRLRAVLVRVRRRRDRARAFRHGNDYKNLVWICVCRKKKIVASRLGRRS
jgi:hypothetical protein